MWIIFENFACALGDGVFGELAGENEPDGGLDLASRHGDPLVVCRKVLVDL